MIGLHHRQQYQLKPAPREARAGSQQLGSQSPVQQIRSSKQMQEPQQQQQPLQHFHAREVNFVRVAAKTATPIVSAVPKCRPNSKASRLHPLETVSGLTGGRALMSEQAQQPLASGGRRLQKRPACELADHADDGALFDQDRVLLIVNDDHITGGGVPIIGRRLPSKSAQQQHAASGGGGRYYGGHPNSNVIDYSQPPTIQVDAAAEQSRMAKLVSSSGWQQPVAGRRSHRIQQQQQQQQPALAQSGLLSSTQVDLHRQSLSTSASIRSRDLQLHQPHQQHQLSPADQFEGRDSRLHQHHHRRSRRPQATCQQQPQPQRHKSLSTLLIGDPNLATDPDQQVSADYAMPQMHLRFESADDVRRAPSVERRRCSERHVANYLYGDTTVAAGQRGPSKRRQQPQESPATATGSCASLCCQPPTSGPAPRVAGHPIHSRPLPSASSAGDYCDDLCCRAYRLPEPDCCDAAHLQRPSRASVRQSSANAHHQHQHQQHYPSGPTTCRANNNGYAPRHSARGYPPGVVVCRSSSCTGEGGRPAGPAEPASRRNVLPLVPAKPRLSAGYPTGAGYLPNSIAAELAEYQRDGRRGRPPKPSAASKQRVQRPPTDEDNEAACNAVTQMYESLAAELKAKLGNPRAAPILLPPKDYDTISRRQGRLTDIELRRSTNPQLVGPAASLGHAHRRAQPSAASSPAQSASGEGAAQAKASQLGDKHSVGATIVGAKEMSAPAEAVSARSSGRSSQDEQSLHECRSRSSSSFGLGSISPSAGSPNSSGSSDSLKREPQTQALGGKRASGSPDEGPHNCAASDSGHSGSGRCLSVGDDQDRKSSLGEDSGELYFSKSYKSSSSSSSSSSSPSSASPSSSSAVMSPSSPPSESRDFERPANGENCNQTISSIGNSSKNSKRGVGIQNHHPSKVSDGVLWNGRVEVPLKINSEKNGHTYLATKQIIY